MIDLGGRKRASEEADGTGLEQMTDDCKKLLRSLKVLDKKTTDQTVRNALRHM